MTPEQYSELCGALEELLQLPDGDRPQALEAVELSSPELKRELVSLLAAEEALPTALLEGGAEGVSSRESLEQPAPGTPDRIGPYRIGPYRIWAVLGQGGMGTVYLGEQTEPIHRRVALKLIKRGMDSERIVQRFGLEREALERMEHPGIARVLDAGQSRDGQPYFAMEFVDGPSILQYCDEAELSISARLEILEQTLRALHHAHQRGILHRDLKPSNILIATIDGEPQPKIIDFGLARAIDREPEQSFATQTGEILGTPAYMSPEQLSGDGKDIDVRSDVYSMGILLFELLTGRRPIDWSGLPPAAAFQLWLKKTGEPAPTPSSKVSTKSDDSELHAGRRQCDARSLQKKLQGELDWITLRSMEADPERRYSSAQLLADDIQAFLENRPIAAGPLELSYRVSKFIRRNRIAVSAAVLVAVSLLLGTVFSLLSAREARTARGEMAEVLDDMRAQNDILYRMLTTPDPRFEGKDTKVIDLLAFGSEYALDAYFDRPSVLTVVMGSLGGNYRELGMYKEAESHLRMALDYQIEADPTAHSQIAFKNNGLGILMRRLGRLDEAEGFYRTAIEEYYKSSPEDQTGEIRSWTYNLGKLLASRGKIDEAREWLERSLQIHIDTGDQSHVGIGLIQLSLANLSRDEGQYDEAHEFYRAALAELEQVDPPAPISSQQRKSPTGALCLSEANLMKPIDS